MNSLDWIFCALGLFALLNGLWQGLIREVLGLAGWLIGFVAAQTFASRVGAQLPVSGASAELRYLMGFVCVLVLCLILVSMVAKLLSTLISAIGLGWVNGLMGAFFAVGKVGVLCLCLTTIVRLTPLQELDVWKQSFLAEYMVNTLNLIKPVLPQEFGKYVI